MYVPFEPVTIVVPTFNERDNIAPLAERIFAALDPASVELLVVDDASPDGTADAARALAPLRPVRVVVRRHERGLSSAVLGGVAESRTPLIVVMDADLSHPPEALPALIEPLRDARVDAVVGSRFVPGGRVDLHWPLHRRLNSLAGRVLARPLTRVRDMMSGYFAFRRAAVDAAALRPVGYKILLELVVRCRWRNVVEIPITFADRAAGVTKLSVAEQLRYLRHLARLYPVAIRAALRGSP